MYNQRRAIDDNRGIGYFERVQQAPWIARLLHPALVNEVEQRPRPRELEQREAAGFITGNQLRLLGRLRGPCELLGDVGARESLCIDNKRSVLNTLGGQYVRRERKPG